MLSILIEAAKISSFYSPFASVDRNASRCSLPLLSTSLSSSSLSPSQSLSLSSTPSPSTPMPSSPALLQSLPRATLRQPVRGRYIQAAAPSEKYSCEFGSNKYFALCGLGGIISCGSTHTLVVPLDLVKCRLQVDQAKYKNLITGTKVTIKEEGIRGLAKGWAPTFFGYSAQGAFKFGFYELFKVKYTGLISEETAYTYRTWVYLAASATAEFFADIALAPFEAMKVKIQTTQGYASTLREAMPKMMAEEGIMAFYKGLVPLWIRQIPYTMMKFACFERTIELLYKHVVPKPRAECTKAEQLIVTFTAGYIAGVFCAIVSHPADVVVSKLNQAKDLSALQVAKSLGFMGMWGGLMPRIIMIGTLTGLQWFVYDGVKVALRLPRPPPPEMPPSLKAKLEKTLSKLEKVQQEREKPKKGSAKRERERLQREMKEKEKEKEN